MRHQEKAGTAQNRLASLSSGLGKPDSALRMHLSEVMCHCPFLLHFLLQKLVLLGRSYVLETFFHPHFQHKLNYFLAVPKETAQFNSTAFCFHRLEFQGDPKVAQLP